MQVGLSLPFTGPLATADAIRAYAQTAEQLGYDSVWVGDHVVFPSGYASHYPYSTAWSGPQKDMPVLDPIATLSFVAAQTNRVRLGTSVLLLPARNPVLQAKSFSTLDVLSRGRSIFGVGVGWLEEEYRALGVPFERRGARADEYLELITLIWTGDEVTFRGEFYSLDPCYVLPAPVQRPHPPVWIGGNSAAALRRVARRGDGWIAAFVDATHLGGLLSELSIYLAEGDRELDHIVVAVMIDMAACGGTSEQQIDTLGQLSELGVRHIIARTQRASPERDQEEMCSFLSCLRKAQL
jgi:probable F420-dependent oxidoreductase